MKTLSSSAGVRLSNTPAAVRAHQRLSLRVRIRHPSALPDVYTGRDLIRFLPILLQHLHPTGVAEPRSDLSVRPDHHAPDTKHRDPPATRSRQSLQAGWQET